jgi:hypothetical protein
MTASIAIRIRYKNSVAILPFGGMQRDHCDFLPAMVPPFNRIVRGYEPQNWSGVLRQWSSCASRVLVHLRQQTTSCISQAFKNNSLLGGVGSHSQKPTPRIRAWVTRSLSRVTKCL